MIYTKINLRSLRPKNLHSLFNQNQHFNI